MITKYEMKQELEALKAENARLRKIVAEYEDCYYDEEYEQECAVNRIVAERFAEEDRKNDERAAEDPDYAWELRQIRYMESSDDDWMY